MIRVEVVTQNPYFELKAANCTTIGKTANSNKIADFQEQKKYFRRCFLAEHSTIEILEFKIFDSECRADVINQIVRSTKGLPRFQVQSSRPDWNNGEKRKPSDETWRMFSSYWNPLSFMQMARQRLCVHAMKETREWVDSVISYMATSSDPMLEALASCCMPQCMYRGCICYELKPCGRFESGNK